MHYENADRGIFFDLGMEVIRLYNVFTEYSLRVRIEFTLLIWQFGGRDSD